ncbi:MAG: hypothetical protein R2706_19025 [Acidimicrobiales bacterium]
MKRSTWTRLMSMLFAMGLVAAACGSDSTDTTGTTEAAENDTATTEAATGDTETTEGEMAGIDLSGVCPAEIVIQTDWFPEAEHGALYEMIGDDYVVDAANQTTTGSLIDAEGNPTGVTLQVRAGGPAIGFAAPRVQMYTDDSITLAYSNLDAQILAWADAPLISVMAPLEINPQIIMWDAETYPDVNTLADLGTAGVTINIFGGAGFQDVFVAQGIWSADQVDPSYDGSPARFIAEGNIAQQGFASAEPYNYEFVFTDYGKAPKYQLLHDAGFETYSQTLAVRPDDLETLSPCLELLVPMVQHAVVDFAADPARANAMIVDAVATIDSFWVYSPELGDYAVQTMNELGLHGNGPDSTVGNIDEARVQKLIDDIKAAGLDVPAIWLLPTCSPTNSLTRHRLLVPAQGE